MNIFPVVFSNLNQRGSAFINALIISVMVGGATAILSNVVVQQSRQSVLTSSNFEADAALNSIADYVLYGIKQNYCFQNLTLLNDSPCDLKHLGNIERLTMSGDTLNFVNKARTAGNILKNSLPPEGTPIQLESISLKFDFSKATPSHPLYPIVSQLMSAMKGDNGVGVAGASIVLKRDHNTHIPISGREVHLIMDVQIISNLDATSSAVFNGKKLSLNSELVIYPRENGSFALIVPTDLDLSSVGGADKGDISIPNYSAWDKSKRGLVFLSPIFVNRNIVLPADTLGLNGNPPSSYTPVTFAGRVFMGNGGVKLGDDHTDFRPPIDKFDATNSQWNQLRTFGGFLSGIENDGALDAGLAYFSGYQNPEAADTSKMNACIDRVNNLANTDWYKDVKSGVVMNSATSEKVNKVQTIKYTYFLSKGDLFNPQTKITPPPNLDCGNKGLSIACSFVRTSPDNKYVPILGIKLSLSDLNINTEYWPMSLKVDKEGNIAKGAGDQMTIKPDVSDVVKVYDTIATMQKELDAANAKVTKTGKVLSAATSAQSSHVTAAHGAYTTALNMWTADEACSGTESCPAKATMDSKKTAWDQAIATQDSVLKPLTEANDAAKKAAAESQMALDKKLNSSGFTTADKTFLLSTSTGLTAGANATKLSTALKSKPPQLQISVDPIEVVAGGSIRQNQVTLTLQITNPENFLMLKEGKIQRFYPSFTLNGYDLSYVDDDGTPGITTERSGVSSQYSSGNLIATLKGFRCSGPNLTSGCETWDQIPNSLENLSGVPLQPESSAQEITRDYIAFKSSCDSAFSSGTSFGSQDWDVSFAKTTRSSWNFAGSTGTEKLPEKAPNDYVVKTLDMTGPAYSAAKPVFKVVSIAHECVIEGDAEVVVGFFTCDNLIIKKRSKLLRIYGSFIANKLSIDKSALESGIRWSSVYTPEAVQYLRSVKILAPKINTTKTCDDLNSDTDPAWNPVPSIILTADRLYCSPVSLRQKADPFRWTAVDPDCGLLNGDTATSCKNRVLRNFVTELMREVGQ